MWELALKRFNKILVPSNPTNNSKYDIGNTNEEEIKKDGLAGKNGSSCTKYCLNEMEKLAVLAKVAMLQSINIWVGDSGASVHCTNDRTKDINIHEGGGIGTMDMHGETMTASSSIDSARTWYNQFCKEQLKVTLKDV